MARESVGSVAISKAQAEWFIQKINEMNAIFEDESRDDWFDGDDIAIEIARELECVLKAHLYEDAMRELQFAMKLLEGRENRQA